MPLSWFGIIEPMYSRHDFQSIFDKYEISARLFVDLRYEQNTIVKYSFIKKQGASITKINEFISQKNGISSRVITPTTRVFSSTPYTLDINAFISTLIKRAKATNQLFGVKQPLQLSKEKTITGDFDFFGYRPEPEHAKIIGNNILMIINENLPSTSRLILDVEFNEKYMIYTNTEGTLFSKREPVWMVSVKANINGKLVQYRFGWVGKPINFPKDAFMTWIERTRPTFELPVMKMSSVPKPEEAVLTPEAAWSIVHEGIGHAVEADLVLHGKSYLAGKLGHKIISSNITIIDDPGVETASNYQLDDEGVKARGSLLIDEGILAQYLSNRETASELGMISTGNARTPSYEHDYYVRQSNLYIEPQDASEEELLENFTGLLFSNSMKASTDTNTGEITIMFSHAIQFINGKMVSWIPRPILKGTINQILGDVLLIGKWVEPSAGYCMKNGSVVPVGSISPMIRSKITDVKIMEGIL